MSAGASITRRLTLSVLLLELLGGLTLVATLTLHEYRVQFLSLESNLRATGNRLLGAVQEADTAEGGLQLELRGLPLPPSAVYQVTADGGRLLAQAGPLPSPLPKQGETFKARVYGQRYRFCRLQGERIVDPGRPYTITHPVQVVYGLPEARTWHEILEAARFSALATGVFLAATAVLLIWLIQHLLEPIRALAAEAGRIDAEHWVFTPPPNSKRLEELRPLALAIESTVARLQRSFEQQRRFTSDAAHELKTDLAIIKSAVQVLSMKRRSPGEYEQGLDASLRDIGRLESTVHRMLTLARLEHAGSTGQSCDLSEVVLETGARLAPLAHAAGVLLQLDEAREARLVPLSRDDAAVLCANLMMNAIQYSGRPGSVSVQSRSEPGWVILRIADNGPGIADGESSLVFQPFYRGDPSRNREKGSTGLGLSICKAMCDRAGGSITIRNYPEGGAIVEVRLPRLTPSL